MRIKLRKAKKLSVSLLRNFNFSAGDSNLITKNLIDAELSGKKTHGLIRLLEIKTKLNGREFSIQKKRIKIVKETPVSYLIDARSKIGPIPIYQSLKLALKKVKKIGLVSVAIRNISLFSGFIGSYAREATENDLIFIGFNNGAGLVPYGAKKKFLGTNPVTIGMPTKNLPVILDMACSKITWGDVFIANERNKKIKEGVALDKDGRLTINPQKVMVEGGLLPIAKHKGSGLAFMVELFAGILTGARSSYPGSNWGTFYLLIDPTLFKPINQFKNDIMEVIKRLKELPKAKGFTKVYFPGEKSTKLRKENLKKGKIEIDSNLYNKLQNLNQ